MRSIESLSTMGVRAAPELIRQAEALTEWVLAAEDKVEQAPPRRSPRKPNEDKQPEGLPS